MSNRTLTVWVGPSIIYLYGTVNGEASTFTLAGDGYWQAIAPRSADDNYELHLEAYSGNGLEGTYDYTLYYGMMDPVTDRTTNDVRGRTPKGFYNYTDLNRVGHNTDFLAGLLSGYGYVVSVTPKKDWARTDIPLEFDMETFLADLSALRDRFYGTVELPDSMSNLTHVMANNIELLQAEIYGLIKIMERRFRPSGTFAAGQVNILPRSVI